MKASLHLPVKLWESRSARPRRAAARALDCALPPTGASSSSSGGRTNDGPRLREVRLRPLGQEPGRSSHRSPRRPQAMGQALSVEGSGKARWPPTSLLTLARTSILGVADAFWEQERGGMYDFRAERSTGPAGCWPTPEMRYQSRGVIGEGKADRPIRAIALRAIGVAWGILLLRSPW